MAENKKALSAKVVEKKYLVRLIFFLLLLPVG
jgi:hypothetical protein